MKKSFVSVAAVLFSVFFLAFVFRLSRDIAGTEQILEASKNVKDVTDLIEVRMLLSSERLPENGEWRKEGFDDAAWEVVRLPHTILGRKDFRPGNFVHYRILLPKASQSGLEGVVDELSLALQYVGFSSTEFHLNGEFFRRSTSGTSGEAMTVLPIRGGEDNLISLVGTIAPGDTGINHRGKILLGKSGELNELHRLAYKGNTVFPLVFILSKGSVLFVFTLIFLLVSVPASFEKFLAFGLFAVAEDFLTGEWLFQYFTLNQLTYAFGLVNVGAVVFLTLFFADALGKKLSRNLVTGGAVFLLALGIISATDVLYHNLVFTFTEFLKLWNLILALVIAVALPLFFRTRKVVFSGLLMALLLILYSSFISQNVGMNLKAYGSLLLFFAIAAETFLLFRREQELLREKESQLLAQERDVAIGKTAALLAHDVRRPLEQLRILLDRVSSGESSPEFLKLARKDVDFALESLKAQVNEIVNFSTTRTPKKVSLSFPQVLESSLRQVFAVDPGVDIKLIYDLRATQQVLGSPGELAGVLTNLLGNAMEAIRDMGQMKAGTIWIATEDSQGNFSFRISNDGPRIPESALSEIWKRGNTFGKSQGSGLGLSGVQKTMEALGGKIEARNDQGGVTFEGILPHSASPEIDQGKELKKNARDYSLGKEKPTFLVVDDSELVREAWAHYHGKNFVSTAENPDEALKILEKGASFDVFILDYYFDGTSLTGIDLARKIQSLRPSARIYIASSGAIPSDEFPVIRKADFELGKG